MVVLSLESWDEVWRRNQHFAHRLVTRGHAREVLFVSPPRRTGVPDFRPEPAIEVRSPRLRLPKRLGGVDLAVHPLRADVRRADVLWVNDPVVGSRLLGLGTPAVYDVTDDWRTAEQSARTARRLVRAEDRLAGGARVIACSAVIQDRWRSRYGVRAALVPNGVDLTAIRGAAAGEPALEGPGPHVGYVGTLHDERIDVPLVLRTADSPAVGTVHLVGPDALSAESRRALASHPAVRVHGPVPSTQVPAWLTALDVLICPHHVSPFTLSLDAIKGHEYLATGRPVVATPTSGFQLLEADGLWVVPAPAFTASVAEAARSARDHGTRGAVDWDRRTDEFAAQLVAAVKDNGGHA